MHEEFSEPKSATIESPIENESGILVLDKGLEDKLVAQALKDYEMSDGDRRSWLAKKDAGLRLHWGILPKKDFPFKNCSNVNVPMLRTLTETLHSNLQGSFDTRMPFNTLPIGPEDIVKASRIRKFLNWQFSSEINFTDVLDKVLYFTLLYGHAVAKCHYVRETRKRKIPGNNGMDIEDEIMFDGVKVDVLNPEDFLFPLNAVTDDVNNPNMSYCIHVIPMTTSEIRRRMASGLYRNIDLESPKHTGDDSISQQILQQTRNIHLGTTRTDSGSPNTLEFRHHRIIEWYGWYDVDGDGIEESVMAVISLDQRKLLRVVLWDISRPFIIIRFSPIFNTPYGESMADLLGRLNEELNTLHNQRVDAVTIANIPFGFYDPMSGFDPDEVQLTPGLLLPTNGVPKDAVYFPAMPSVKPEYYREEEMISSYGERLVGAGANTQGIINPRRLSATEIATVDRRAGIRFLTIFQRIKAGVEAMAKLVLELDQRFMPAIKQVRVMGANDYPIFESQLSFERFRREEMQGKFDIIANAASIADEAANKQEQMVIYQLALSNPLIMSDPESIYEVTKDTLQALGAKNLGAYLKKPQTASPQNPEDEHNRMAQGDDVDPVIGENIDRHLQEHRKFVSSPQFQLIPIEGQILIIKHIQKTEKMQVIVQQLQENQQRMVQLQQQRMMGMADAQAESEHRRDMEREALKQHGKDKRKS